MLINEYANKTKDAIIRIFENSHSFVDLYRGYLIAPPAFSINSLALFEASTSEK